MQVSINNELKEIDNGTSLSKLLTDIHISSTKGIAVAVNEEVIGKQNWENFKLKDNDKIILIKATQGG